ncbi:dienelactone hydrolase family protein [Pseudomonas chlororaphis]|uniref:dienelactone hydrolase family protein n=1 Tax=Pseudomonas chlororaphis TaxID=587753 RepID=UPI0006A58B48|nr:dienelactone hydrolase family protein [Pseudomonas chlororaphis]AZD02337.1 Protein-L-isoaspartate O-methyltransferase [Pseudomonas chlororaphis subsp. chlororaphis]MBM0280391.1 dienelactone hydrolase family protein [Pseudomonas chlororaphis]MDO1504969.1 alpha/beta hydrolase [Pseudomonas chlororaphis]ORM44869.1 hydrolase [Pseudomonas chlororaphis subsp. chlororaphis]TWR96089.1 alpha/beta hydrolase [Pseudomonas chlororaphis subsp. chlororaphis]
MFEPRSRQLDLEGIELSADLRLPPGARALVVFAHGSGSGRSSPRNRYVAESLARHGLGSLLSDLLTETEQHLDNRTRELRFDIALLARRLTEVIDWIGRDLELQSLRIGLFGASTGAAAALLAAAARPDVVHAVVSRGGRTDLAGPVLSRVKAPTLQIVGAQDPVVFGLNCQSSRALQCEQRLEVVAGATHLFEEPGALEEVARLAGDWFETYLHGPAP